MPLGSLKALLKSSKASAVLDEHDESALQQATNAAAKIAIASTTSRLIPVHLPLHECKTIDLSPVAAAILSNPESVLL